MRHERAPSGGRRTLSYESWEGYGAVRAEGWFRPGESLQLDGEQLKLDRPLLSGDVVKAGPGLLTGFLSLAGGSRRSVLMYAREWGLLDLCNHQLPFDHPMEIGLPPCLAQTSSRVLLSNVDCHQLHGAEPVASWQFWASQALALTNVGVQLRKGLATDPRDVSRLFTRAPWMPEVLESVRGPWEQLPRPSIDVTTSPYLAELERSRSATRLRVAERPPVTSELRELVRDAMSFWLEMARVGLRLIWPGGRPDVVLTGGLFANIGIQLLMTISGSQGFAFCAGCGNVHIPARPNDTRRASYCPRCREEGVPRRDAQRRYEARKRRRGDP